jgi:hypothetical protein
MRTACCRVPDLPLAAKLRANPELEVRPLAVASPALERTAREALLDAALSLSPRAALVPRASGAFAAEAAVLVDASGVSALFSTEQGRAAPAQRAKGERRRAPAEHAFAAALEQRCQRLGLPSCVAIASSQSVARIAARGLSAGEVRVLPPGSEAAFLAPLPLDILDPDDELAEALTRFGVRCVHDLLALPRRALGTRLGPRVLKLVGSSRSASCSRVSYRGFWPGSRLGGSPALSWSCASTSRAGDAMPGASASPHRPSTCGC